MPIKFVLKQIHSLASEANDSVIGEYVYDGSLFTIGSDAGGTIVLTKSAPEQAVVIQEGEHLTLINGAEGTNLNGRDLRREAIEPLAVGDEIKIGDYVISVVSAGVASEGSQNGAASPANKTFLPAEPIATVSADEREKNFQLNRADKFASPAQKPARNFADILNTLRTEEDSFYFIVKNAAQEKEEARIPLEQTEMPLGFDAQGEISCAVEQITALYAIVRKDWSGIMVESQRRSGVFVNDEAVQTTRRLRNGDRVTFNAPRKNGKPASYLQLHEPSSLVALESILEPRRGSENSLTNGAPGAGNSSTDESLAAQPAISVLERRFFGYFNLFEVAVMAIGTLIAAVLIFLLLEFIVG